jgi:phage gpG-like protein
MSGIKVDTSAVATMLKNAAAGLNQDAAGELAAKIVKEDVKGHFDAGGRPTRWAAPKWRSGAPLVNTGILRNSIFHGKDGNGWRVFTNDVRAGTLHYGAKQGAFGRSKRNGPLPWGNIPARPIMVLRPEAVEKILAALKRRTEGGA